MWLFTTNSFLSIVQHRDKHTHLLVRGRLPGDIEEIFPGATVRESDETEYRYRAVIRKSVVAKAIAKQIVEIDYYNFTDTLDDPERIHSYQAFWSLMRRLQEEVTEDKDLFALAFAADLEDDEQDEATE